MDSVLQFYKETRQRFPHLLEKTDREHRKSWDLDDDYAYCWFQSLANTTNAAMRKETGVDDAAMVFDYMTERFLAGDADIQNCIDVSFVENLFWQVSQQKARSYWQRMPELLQNLYLGFHGQPPC